jgi:hypothetical protein
MFHHWGCHLVSEAFEIKHAQLFPVGDDNQRVGAFGTS